MFDTSSGAAWRGWFQVPRLRLFHVASQDKRRALLCHDASGTPQLYAFDLDTGEQRQLTGSPNGTRIGTISADGRTVYYLDDAQGDDIGHFFRLDLAGGTAHDLTPDWPAYTSLHIGESASGSVYGFMTLSQLGSQMFVVDARAGGAPHLRYESEALTIGPFLSYDAELAVVMTLDEGGHTLESYDVRGGQRVAGLSSPALIEPAGFVPRPHDMRFLAVSLETGLRRPFIWNARTGERRDLPLAPDASVVPLDWSSDGEQITALHYGPSGTFTGLYRVKMGDALRVATLDHHLVEAAHWHQGALWTLAQQPHQPPRVLREGQTVLSLPAPTLPPVTITHSGALTRYEQASGWHIVIAHVDEQALPQRYQPMVGAWLSLGASVSWWFSLVNHGMLPDQPAGDLITQEAAALRSLLAQAEGSPHRVLVASQLAALAARQAADHASALILIDPPPGAPIDGAPCPTLVLHSADLPDEADRDEQHMARVLAWLNGLEPTQP